MKVIKIANSDEVEKRRKTLAARLAELFLEMFEVMEQIERLHK